MRMERERSLASLCGSFRFVVPVDTDCCSAADSKAHPAPAGAGATAAAASMYYHGLQLLLSLLSGSAGVRAVACLFFFL